MKYKIYIYIIITVLYVQLYRQSSKADKKQKKKPGQSMGMETDKCIQEGTIDSTNRYIQSNEANWQNGSIIRLHMGYRYMQYEQYERSIQHIWPATQDNIYRFYYSTNNTYENNISRKRTRTEQTPSAINSIDTDNSVNTALNMPVPYTAKRAKKPNTDIVIASASADSDTDSDSADALMDIKSIKEYIHIEEEYIVINMYIFCKIRNLAILKKEIKKYNRNTVYAQYNPAGVIHKYINEAVSTINELFDKYSTIVVWCYSNKHHKDKQKPKPKNALLGKFNNMHTELQQFTERTNRYMNSEDNTNKKRIVLYNISIHCIRNLANLIKNRNIISCYLTKRSNSDSYNIWNTLGGMQAIYVLDIVASGQLVNSALVTFFANDNNESKPNTGTAINANSYTEDTDVNRGSIDSNDSTNTHTGKDKAHLELTIAYLSLIDRVHNYTGIGSICYIVKKVTERLDLSYLLWKQLRDQNSTVSVPAHMLVIYTTINGKNKKDSQQQAQQNTEHIERKNSNATINKSSQSDTNVSGAEYIKDIITSTYTHITFPNLETLVIYAYESDHKIIKTNIIKWLNPDEQKNETPQTEEQQNKQSNSQKKQKNNKKPLQHIMVNLQEIQIYFIPNNIEADSIEIITSAYIYDDQNKPNLRCLCCSKDENGIFTINTPKETNTTTTAPVPVSTTPTAETRLYAIQTIPVIYVFTYNATLFPQY
ncbi:hypothetical protein NEOKW01_1335 [Nematocida sp. AWRm80]|nr:hypothetical protein NEOKW01_1335 [Nematocida sp. AWRm80]